MSPQPEKLIENHILNWLAWNKFFVWKNQSVGIFDPVKKIYRKPNSIHHLKGVSDILGIYKGRFLAIEVKSQTGVVSKEQKEFINNVNKEGGIAFVARSIEDVKKALEEIK